VRDRVRTIVGGLVLLVVAGVSYAAGVRAQPAAAVVQESLEGQLYEAASGLTLEILFDGRHRQADVDVAEITFPPGTRSGDHRHDPTEIFYVLEGRLGHVVDGESRVLEPGTLGFVEPPAAVNHITDADGGATRAVVIWSPAGEAARLASNWRRVR